MIVTGYEKTWLTSTSNEVMKFIPFLDNIAAFMHFLLI